MLGRTTVRPVPNAKVIKILIHSAAWIEFFSSLHRLAVPVFPRRHAGLLLEEGAELRGVVEAQFVLNFFLVTSKIKGTSKNR